MNRLKFCSVIYMAGLFLITWPVAAQPNKQPPNSNTPNNTSPNSNLRLPSNSSVNQQRINVSQPQEINRYTLGPGDNIKIDIFNVPELSGQQIVAPDGTINISLVGAVQVEGLTIEQAARLLENRLGPYLVRKIVNVSLIDPRPLNIAVVGEVNRPGTRILTYSRNTATGRDAQAATLSRALEAAGGITQQADIANIQVSRRDLNGQRRTFRVNLTALVQQGDVSQDIRIQDGDSILIPRLTDATAQIREIANASFAADSFSIRIAVSGEVNRTGPQVLTYSRLSANAAANSREQIDQIPTITRALQSAGGITERADIRNVQISRLGPSGERTTITANLWDLIQKADISQDIRLADGDLVTVPIATTQNAAEYGQIAKASFSPDVIAVQVIGEVVKPGPVQLRPNTPFTQAITAAGGITNDGDWKAVELYRVNPDGSLTRRNLVADLNLAPNEENNPGLRDRDVIVVRPSFGASILGATTRLLGNIVTPITLLDRLFRP